MICQKQSIYHLDQRLEPYYVKESALQIQGFSHVMSKQSLQVFFDLLWILELVRPGSGRVSLSKRDPI